LAIEFHQGIPQGNLRFNWRSRKTPQSEAYFLVLAQPFMAGWRADTFTPGIHARNAALKGLKVVDPVTPP